MVFVFLAFVGFETAAPLGEETHNPKRNIPLAVIYSAIAIGILYMLAAYAGVIGWGISGIQGYAASASPWTNLGKKFWGEIGPVLLSFAIINSAVGNAGVNATSRVAYSMGRIGTLPVAFARVTSRQTPGLSIIVHSIAALVISIGTGLILGPLNAFGLIGTILTLGLLLLYMAVCISVFVFYRRERPQDFSIVKHVIVPIIPTFILIFPLVAQVYPAPPYPLTLALPILLVWIAIGVGGMFYLNARNPAALERGKEVYLQDSETEPVDLLEVIEGK